MEKAVIYMRTSSAANAGDEKDSRNRQESACRAWASENGFQIAKTFYDAGVSGTVDHRSRPSFSSMIAHCQHSGSKTILCEDISRFSRDLMTQEQGYQELLALGLRLIPVNMPDLFTYNADHSRTMIRQILGSMVQFEKSAMVARLKHARKEEAAKNEAAGYLTLSGKGKCEGRKAMWEKNPELIRVVKSLRRKKPNQKRMSYQKISDKLFQMGYMTSNGKAYDPRQIIKFLKMPAGK